LTRPKHEEEEVGAEERCDEDAEDDGEDFGGDNVVVVQFCGAAAEGLDVCLEVLVL